ncbi:sensor histidine kinase [Anaeromyxobacter diazotrophicus]|uniref:histidine kinase n=1 Tax=Anaeromyxobacter diazotrophicus TaxID=2590199 RepID=A0A7I9VNK5_9BACT|nr:GAF domain-containing protein [Anaeromyxobacter diazotrophicus]GEJ57981.1 hypothetical protein AMYX_27220 [Anaeromyxobacter diazotrophicus]
MGQGEDPALWRYAVALGLAAAAVAAGAALQGELRGYASFLSFGAVLLAGLRGGAGPGFLALGVCAAAFAWQMGGPRSATWVEEPDPLHRLAFFVGFTALGVWAASAVREGYRYSHARRRRAEARAEGQRIAAELGARALAETDLDALLAATVAAVERALRCDAVTLLELQPDGESVRLREAAGLARTAAGQVFPRAEALLAFRVLAAREPLAVDDLAAEPEVASPALLRAGVTSSLVAPIVAAGPGGRSFGTLGAHSRARRPFGPDEASFLQAAANVIGTVVVRARAEERVRRTLEVERFLAEASRQLALSIDWQETLTRIAKLAVPFLGDWSLVVVLDGEGRPRSLAAEASDPARAAEARELLDRYPIDLAARHGVGRILRTGEPELLPEAAGDAFVEDDPGEGTPLRRDILRRLGMRSYLGAPLVSAGRVLGAIAFGVADGPRRYGPDDLAVAQALAQRCAAAIENARLYREAQEATRAREEVLAIVSHDLKTPLGALHMGAQMVTRLAPPGAPGDELRKAATTVRRTAERMGRLIHDLVDVASLEAGRPSLAPAEQEAAAVAREAAEALQALAADRGVALTVEAPEAVPLRCDRDRLLQVLTNLLANALQVTPAGGRVRLSARRGGEGVLFTVADDGPGIPAEDLPHLFERWYRGRRARYPGSGLGLAIARAIVEAHGGRIWVESVEGQGSAFSFALPCAGAGGAARAGR